MANQETKKCAYVPCLCDVASGEEFCSETCRDAGRDNVKIACQCDHPLCPLTFRYFATRIAAEFADDNKR